MAGPATLRPPPPCAPRWHKLLAVAVLLATAGCSGAADSPSTPRSTQPPAAPTDTSATVPPSTETGSPRSSRSPVPPA